MLSVSEEIRPKHCCDEIAGQKDQAENRDDLDGCAVIGGIVSELEQSLVQFCGVLLVRNGQRLILMRNGVLKMLNRILYLVFENPVACSVVLSAFRHVGKHGMESMLKGDGVVPGFASY